MWLRLLGTSHILTNGSSLKVGASAFEAVVYIDQTMGFKFYRGYGWAQEEDTKNLYTVEPANLITRNAPGDLIPGPDLKPDFIQYILIKPVK